jgi:hypothetical protein
MAKQLAERLKNWIPSNILNGGPSEQEQQLQQQNQALQGQVQQLTQQLTEKMEALKLEKQRLDMAYLNHTALRVDNDAEQRTAAYNAETTRLKTLGPSLTAEMLAPVIANMLVDILNGPEITPPQMQTPPDAAQIMGEGASQILDNGAPAGQNI